MSCNFRKLCNITEILCVGATECYQYDLLSHQKPKQKQDPPFTKTYEEFWNDLCNTFIK